MKKICPIMLSLLMLITLAACNTTKSGSSTPEQSNKATTATNSQSASSGDVFKIGVHIPLTGTNAVQGQAGLNSIMLYAKRLNESQGGFMGKTIEVIAYDDQNSPEVAATVATKLIEVDNVDIAVNGIGSSCCLASGQLFNDAGIPTFGLGISKTFMSQGWKYQFRPTINSTISVATLPTTMKSLGFSKLAILTGQDDYGINNRNVMLESAPAAGLELVADETMVTGDTDFSGQISSMLNANPDIVFVGINSGDVTTAIKQLRQFGWDGIIYYSENLQSNMLEITGDAANYTAFAYPYVLYSSIDDISNPLMKEYYELYQTEYNTLPEGDCAYRGWDTMIILEEAIKQADSLDKEAIKDAILGISGLNILAGTADFSTTKNGECLTEYYNFIIIDGKNVSMDDWLKTDDAKNYVAQ